MNAAPPLPVDHTRTACALFDDCAPGRRRCLDALAFSEMALDRMMPLHLIVAMDGRILRYGPTAWKVLAPQGETGGQDLFDLLEFRKPRGARTVARLLAAESGRLRLALRGPEPLAMKAAIVDLPCRGGALLNLSFSISVAEAVARFGLTAGDFAVTDLAVELLYLKEAKGAALEDARRLNLRLQGARIAAEERSFSDILTGLQNRRALDQVLGRLVATSQRFSLMSVDLDFFKSVNDTHGHAAGDAVLQVIARRLLALTRPSDLVSRVGGDEFVLVFPGLENRDALSDLARRFIKALEAPIPYKDTTLRISASVGIATTSPENMTRPDALIAEADTALYASKHAGRGRFSHFLDAG